MARLPQQHAPLVYGIIQAAITTAVATAIATHQMTDFRMWFVEEVIRLGASLFDHAARCGLRFTVHSAVCLGFNGFYC